MKFSPFPTLKTKRLILRETTLSDINEVFQLRSDKEVLKYIKREPFKKIEEAEEFITKIAKEIKVGNSIEWSICLKKDSITIGSICLWNIDEKENTAELGYSLLTEYHNKGIMTESIQVVLDYGFNSLQFKMIDAYTDYENKASVSLLLKNGFVLNKSKRDENNEKNRVYELINPLSL